MREKQRTYIDNIPFDALIEMSEEYSASIPSYTTEDGFKVSDTIINEQLSVSMTLFVSEAPITWSLDGESGKDHVDDIIERLKELYVKKTKFKLTVPDGVFENMCIENMSITKDVELGYSKEIPITLKQVKVVSSKTADIPSSYYYSGKTKTSTGTAATEEATPSSLALQIGKYVGAYSN